MLVVVAQFTAKTTNSENLKPHMLFRCKKNVCSRKWWRGVLAPPYLPTRPTSPFLYGPVDYFSKKKLHFGTSEQISTYGKINLLPIKSIYLVFSSRERKRRLIQTKIYYKLFYCLKRNISKSFKSDSCKNVLPKYVYH